MQKSTECHAVEITKDLEPYDWLRASTLNLYQVYCTYNFTSMTKRENGENASGLLRILDKHLNERNCQHSAEDLFDRYSL